MNKILIANRSEIAARICRTCKDLGLTSIAVYEENDLDRPHPFLADEAYQLEKTNETSGYMDVEQILRVAHDANADAIHPGYGFLSENPVFPRRCKEKNITFIGPSEHAIAMSGDKMEARAHAESEDVPVIPGQHLEDETAEDALKKAKQVGFPLMVKAAVGGGGRGIRIVQKEDNFLDTFRDAREESRKTFNSEQLFLERYFPDAHHIEIQIIGDAHGNVLHLGERECSIQRRHQKLIEETPSPFIDREKRHEIGQYAVQLMEAIDYEGAGTVEFLVDSHQNPYFLEINPRLQVEHPVTELCTGLDLVQLQIDVARNQSLPLEQSELIHRGHAIECRICSEKPFSGFLPTAGKLHNITMPAGPHVRVDSGIQTGSHISTEFDSMLAKIITWGPTRTRSLQRMHRALSESCIVGLQTTIPLYKQIMKESDFQSGNYDTNYLDDHSFSSPSPSPEEIQQLANISAAMQYEQEGISVKQQHSLSTGETSSWYFSGLRRQLHGGN